MAILPAGVDRLPGLFRLRRRPYGGQGPCLDIPDRIHQTAKEHFAVRIHMKFVVPKIAFDLSQEFVWSEKIVAELQKMIWVISYLVSLNLEFPQPLHHRRGL